MYVTLLVMSDSLQPHGLYPAGLLCPWDSPDKNTRVKKKKKEYKSGLPLPSPGDLSDPGIQPKTPALQADSLPSELFIFHIMLKILLEDTNKNS